jgi:leucyl aminopeptidase
MKIDFTSNINELTSNCEIHFLYKTDNEFHLTESAKQVDEKTNGLITKTITKNNYKGKFGTGFFITTDTLQSDEALIVSIDDKDKFDQLKAKKVGSAIYTMLQDRGTTGNVIVHADNSMEKNMASQIGFGLLLKQYSFSKYFTGKKIPKVNDFDIHIKDDNGQLLTFQALSNMADSIAFTKDLISEPSNVLYPESYADKIKELEKIGLKVTVYGERELEKIGMTALLSVGQGSARESKMVVMEWNGAQDDTQPLALVGKGVTFDTGGYSIKPSKGMGDMKYDMGGSAVVVGTMMSLALRKTPKNVVGVVGLVENMVSSTAYKPGDVINSLSGQTIEIDNTDAEGRVVLADCLYYTQREYKPSAMVNLATLTGAISVALGDQIAGLFSNNDKLSNELLKAGEKTGEDLWRLPCDPIGERYDTYVDSSIADMHNVGKGYEASSTTAAQFLQRFVNETPWAHLDIAGVTWNDKGSMTASGGATGWGVELLNKWIDSKIQ